MYFGEFLLYPTTELSGGAFSARSNDWLSRMYMFDIAALVLTFLAIRERCKMVFSRKNMQTNPITSTCTHF